MNYELFEHPDKKIFLVDMKRENTNIFSELAIKGIEKYLKEGKRIGIIVNKKGYASGSICEDCGFVPKCKNCDVSIAYHKDKSGAYFGICHICKHHYNQTTMCENCGGYNINKYGIGTQQIQEIIKNRFDQNSLIIESDTANSEQKITKILNNVKKNQIIIGTSILTTPIHDHSFDLILFINADIGLNIPDYQSNYRNFLFLYETFSKHKTSNYIVQTFKPESYSILHACQMDLEGFKKRELQFRENYSYPPYVEMCVILYKNEIETSVFNRVNKLYQEIMFLKEHKKLDDLEIFSTPPLIYKMFGKYRYNIIIKGPKIRELIDEIYLNLKIKQRGFLIDWEPENII